MTKDGTRKASYRYNGHGERVIKIRYTAQGERTTIYHYDPHGRLIAETRYNTHGVKTTEREYLWLDDRPLAQITTRYTPSGTVKATQTVYLHADHLNTPRLATDQHERVVWRWDADAFGQGKADRDPDGDGHRVTIPLRFPGQYKDPESGLHYNCFTDYDPKMGRYLTSDPIGLSGGINSYIYSFDNPTRYRDPYGLFDIDIAENISVGVSGIVPLSPSGFGVGGKFGFTIWKCCTVRNTTANELFVSGGVGPGAGGLVSLSSAPSGNIGLLRTGELPNCLDDEKASVDLGPSVEFKGRSGVGPSTGISRDGLVVGAGLQAGAGMLVLPKESATVIFQNDTGKPCECRE